MSGLPPPQERAPGTDSIDHTDEELVLLVAARDADALATLYDRYRTMTYSLALRITADSGLAEDAVQDAFLGVWRNAARFTASRASARTWIMAITHHRAIDTVRRRRTTGPLPEAESLPGPLVLPDVWPEVAGRLDRQAIVSAFARLSEPQRQALELAYFGGLTHAEIAERTATPLGTIKSRVRLGLLALREALLESGAEGTQLLASAGGERREEHHA